MNDIGKIEYLLNENKTQFQKDLSNVKNLQELEELRVKYFGRNGLLNKLIEMLKNFDSEEKKQWGPVFNDLKHEFKVKFETKKNLIEQEIKELDTYKEVNFDVTAYKPFQYSGTLHPYSHLIEQCENILISMGYDIVEGPEIETEYHNFDALNIPTNHPARDMHDTFWLTIPEKLMRTHTSTVQVHVMKSKKPPISIATLGRCYRNEATDSSHDFMFMQLEILFIDKFVSISNLIATAKTFLKALFKKDNLEIRLRPSYFPFVQPGVEIDINCIFCANGCSVCKFTKWIELCGAGLVHPNVLTYCDIDPTEYGGFAFGFGLTRLAMLKYVIPDVRILHSNKLDFLKQF